MTRRYDPRHARLHLSYTRAELAELFHVGLPTICAWKHKGLQPIDERRPYLFAGADVRRFLEQHNKPRQPTGPGEIFCVACKRVVSPKGSLVDFVPLGPTNGNLIGSCPHCSRRVWQRVSIADVGKKAGDLTVRYQDGSATLPVSAEPVHTQPSVGDGA